MFYILKPESEEAEIVERLNRIKGPSPLTKQYTQVIRPNSDDYHYVLLPVQEDAQSVLTPEEWASRLATMPVEFVRPLPE
jgi:hypothetical protein